MDRPQGMKEKVLLINPPLYFDLGKPHSLDTSVPPLGILYLASYINKYSSIFEAEVVDMAAEGVTLSDIVTRIENSLPFAIGISSMTPQLQGCVELARAIKGSWAKPPIFLGGPHISADPGFVYRFNGLFDYAIVGEAEKTFYESLETIRLGHPVPNFQKAEPITNLDIIPFPNRSMQYPGRTSVIFSRGCPYNCYYCSRPAIHNEVRYRSAENMLEELEHCGDKVDFQDDTFTLNREKAMELCNALIDNGFKIDWRCNTRIDLVDEELLTVMKKAGCSLIHFGIEAGNEEVRKHIVNKGNFTNETVYRVIKMCKKAGIKTAGYFMLGHPGETVSTLNDTKKMIFKLGIDVLGLSIPTPFPGSKLYYIAGVNEAVIDLFATSELVGAYLGHYPTIISNQLKPEYVYKVMREINRRFYFKPGVILNRLREDIFSINKLKQDVKDFASLVTKGVSTRKPYVKKI